MHLQRVRDAELAMEHLWKSMSLMCFSLGWRPWAHAGSPGTSFGPLSLPFQPYRWRTVPLYPKALAFLRALQLLCSRLPPWHFPDVEFWFALDSHLELPRQILAKPSSKYRQSASAMPSLQHPYHVWRLLP